MVILFTFLFVGCATESSDELEAELKATNDAILATNEVLLERIELEETAVPPPTAVPDQPTLTPPPIETPTPMPEVNPTDEPIEEPTAQTEVEIVEEPEVNQPSIEAVSFTAVDGLEIQATYALPGGKAPFPGIILLHMLGSDRDVWEQTGFTDALRLQGYAVLAIDMRGHGETGGAIDWELAREDMAAIYDQFIEWPEIDSENTAVIGASIGSNMALTLAVDRPEIDTAVLLSPGLDYRGVVTGDLPPAYGSRPLYIAVSQEDGYSASSSQTLIELAENGILELYNGIGHGTTMLSNEPALTEVILGWLDEVIEGG